MESKFWPKLGHINSVVSSSEKSLIALIRNPNQSRTKPTQKKSFKMKAIFFIAFLFVAGVAAQNHHHKDIQKTLIERGEALIHATKQVVADHHLRGHGHLVEAIEHTLIEVEAMVTLLKKEHADPKHLPELHHLHATEEELLHFENRISEELAIAEYIIHNHHHNGGDKKHILERAAALIKKAREAVEEHKSHNHKEVKEVEHEITVVEKLVKAIELTKDGDDLKKEEAALARHEKTLVQLLERMNHRHHHNN